MESDILLYGPDGTVVGMLVIGVFMTIGIESQSFYFLMSSFLNKKNIFDKSNVIILPDHRHAHDKKLGKSIKKDQHKKAA